MGYINVWLWDSRYICMKVECMYTHAHTHIPCSNRSRFNQELQFEMCHIYLSFKIKCAIFNSAVDVLHNDTLEFTQSLSHY